MNVVICCIEDPIYGMRLTASQLDFNQDSGSFSMPCIMGDDWFQKVNYVPSPPASVVRFIEDTALVVFHLQADAEKFEQWLTRANLEVEHGFRTMQG